MRTVIMGLGVYLGVITEACSPAKGLQGNRALAFGLLRAPHHDLIH